MTEWAFEYSPQNTPLTRCCVIIPTYNNHLTLAKVIDGVLGHVTDVIVVNDGSSDSTEEILSAYPQIQKIHLEENKGKGNALRLGFEKAIASGYTHAITIDSDGQHFPEDIPIFLDQLDKEVDKDVLLIGARNMDQGSVPKKSSFGNRFSNFWYKVETGITLQDTQSGFRLYPLKSVSDLTLWTHKFEYEIEVIVKAAWNGTAVRNIPIRVHYDEVDRVSHFRPFKDFTRISILNTYLVIVAFLYIKPRDLIRRIRRIGFKRFIKEDFLANGDSPRKKALSIGLGLLIGLSPFWGFHSVIVISLAILLKLNKVIAFAFSNISLPPFIPLVVYVSSATGSFILGEEATYDLSDFQTDFEPLTHLKIYLFGSFTLAIISGVVFGLAGYFLFTLLERNKATRLG